MLVFTCNHCPYVIAWHERIQDVARDYAERGVRVLPINANDAVAHPRDSFEAMQARVRDAAVAVPYLHDETQEVARAWAPRRRPTCSSPTARAAGLPRRAGRRPRRRANAEWLRAALDDALAGRAGRGRDQPGGCSIKWRA